MAAFRKAVESAVSNLEKLTSSIPSLPFAQPPSSKEGWLAKPQRFSGDAIERYYRLVSDGGPGEELQYFTSEDPAAHPKGAVLLGPLTTVRCNGSDILVDGCRDGRSHLLHASSTKLASEWSAALTQCLQKYANRHAALVAQRQSARDIQRDA